MTLTDKFYFYFEADRPIAHTNQTKFIQQRRQIQHNVYGLPQYPNRSHTVHWEE
ncbi:hypothetical protein QUA30_19765 [Microcoleus sp. Pol14C2]|uniref:hypothetical protein n=1 Tax=unclassified Microcoleus TaxID=2642155 RepID=UPI002FD0790D